LNCNTAFTFDGFILFLYPLDNNFELLVSRQRSELSLLPPPSALRGRNKSFLVIWLYKIVKLQRTLNQGRVTTPSVNSTNILRTAFRLVDPERVKIQLSHQYLFTLLGSASVKAVVKMLMKLSPSENIVCHHQISEIDISFSTLSQAHDTALVYNTSI